MEKLSAIRGDWQAGKSEFKRIKAGREFAADEIWVVDEWDSWLKISLVSLSSACVFLVFLCYFGSD